MGFLTAAAAWFFGNSNGAQTVATVVDKAIYTDQEKAGDDASDLAAARSFAGVSNQPGLINQLVDAANRCIRPGVTLAVVGGAIGWWDLPDPSRMGEYWQSVLYMVLVFWFGSRTLIKELPATLRALRK